MRRRLNLPLAESESLEVVVNCHATLPGAAYNVGVQSLEASGIPQVIRHTGSHLVVFVEP
jgi:hypothetical protein